LVSAIIPARNEEESIARAVESVAAQPEIDEVIVVDDGSTDGTARILSELGSRLPKLKVMQAGELQAGWVGKNHAVSVGAAAASGDWLLFTDADTFHLPGAMRRALADAVEHDAVLVSYSPEQEMETWWERALIPFVFCRLAAKFSYARVNDPELPDAAANGQFILILRDAYDKAGGYGAIAGEIVDDVALARGIKGMGCKIYFTAPFGIVGTRMYRTFGAMWDGWTKNLFGLIGGDSRSGLRELGAVVAMPILVVFFCFFNSKAIVRDLGFFSVCVALAIIAWHFLYGIELYRNLYPIPYIKYLVPAVCLYSAAFIASWWKSTRGVVTWKGRTYPAGSHGGAVRQGTR